MANRKPNADGLIVQDFVTKVQAMAYTLRGEVKFDEDIKPYVNIYEAGHGEAYYIPELRKRMLNLLVVKSKM